MLSFLRKLFKKKTRRATGCQLKSLKSFKYKIFLKLEFRFDIQIKNTTLREFFFGIYKIFKYVVRRNKQVIITWREGDARGMRGSPVGETRSESYSLTSPVPSSPVVWFFLPVQSLLIIHNGGAWMFPFNSTTNSKGNFQTYA